MVQQWLGFRAPALPGSKYVPAIFGTILFFYGGMVFLRGAALEIKDRPPGMMTLISLAITVDESGSAGNPARKRRKSSRISSGDARCRWKPSEMSKLEIRVSLTS